jgi:hypothetical protein
MRFFQDKSKMKGCSPQGCDCQECESGTSFRRFVSPEEEKEILEKYQDQLQKELAGVKAHIEKIEKK